MRKALDDVQYSIENANQGCLLEVRKGRPVILFCLSDESWEQYDFIERTEGIGDHGGGDWNWKELKVWKRALIKVIKDIDETLALENKQPNSEEI